MTGEKACRACKRLVEGKECVVCKGKDLTRNWKGVVLIYDPESEIAKKSGHAVPGKYALQIV
ncbi:MAG: DNA-directed RNA polymerase subunit E'' [Candidatus Aenigmarchaeota archaeon]|nr:DNA-directed RNA polymerase subunit E'' [Candidatus Aenigmarchaeota archaeon]